MNRRECVTLILKISLQVNKIIDNGVSEYLIPCVNTNENKIDIKFVVELTEEIRGFAGVNTVYVNANHFLQNLNDFRSIVDDEYLDLIMKVDVINLILHEYSHIKLRKVCNVNYIFFIHVLMSFFLGTQ